MALPSVVITVSAYPLDMAKSTTKNENKCFTVFENCINEVVVLKIQRTQRK